MKIGVASDHRGYLRKKEIIQYLKSKGYSCFDYGTNSEDSVDFPKYAFKLCENMKNLSFGILICGSGIGMSIAANKVKGIRCAKVNSQNDAFYTRNDNDANVIALSSAMNLNKQLKIIDVFLNTEFSNLDRYVRRNKMVDNYDL